MLHIFNDVGVVAAANYINKYKILNIIFWYGKKWVRLGFKHEPLAYDANARQVGVLGLTKAKKKKIWFRVT